MIAIVVSLSCNGCGGDKEKVTFDVEDKREEVRLIETGEGKDVCFVSDERIRANDIVPGRYLVLSSVAGVSQDVDTGGKISHYSRYELHLYDLKNGELTKVIDVNKILEQKGGKDYQIEGISSCNTAEVEGKECIRLYMERIPNGKDDSWKTDRMYLNIDVNTWDSFWMKTEDEREEVKIDSEVERETSIFDEWGEYSLVEANGFAVEETEDGKGKYFLVGAYPCWKGMVQIKMSTEYLPGKNEALYSEFPKLKEYQGEEGLAVCIYLSDYPSAEEIFKLFMEEGQEVSFEGAVLDAELSIDGQEHEIHSFEEYYQWRK